MPRKINAYCGLLSLMVVCTLYGFSRTWSLLLVREQYVHGKNPARYVEYQNGEAVPRTLPPTAVNDRKEYFEIVADKQLWGKGDDGADFSISGSGSTLAVTAPVRACLGAWFQKYNITVMVDVPCGDGHWQSRISGIENVEYFGYDIAKTAVERAQRKNANKTNMHFAIHDMVSTAPAQPSNPDLIMVRDVIGHLPLSMGKAFLVNAKRTGARFIAAATVKGTVNAELGSPSMYGYRENLHAEPFNLPAPLEFCANYGGSDDWEDEVLHGTGKGSDELFELIDLHAWNPPVSA